MPKKPATETPAETPAITEEIKSDEIQPAEIRAENADEETPSLFDGRFNADVITEDSPGIVEMVKKPKVQKAVEMTEDFAVTTPHGVATGKAGDFLMIAAPDDKYPVAKEFIEENYIRAGEDSGETNENEPSYAQVVAGLEQSVEQTEFFVGQLNKVMDWVAANQSNIVLIGDGTDDAASIIVRVLAEQKQQVVVIAGERDEFRRLLEQERSIKSEDLIAAFGSDAIVPDGRMLAEGTKLMFAGEQVVLTSAAIVDFPGAQSEAKFVGMCAQTDNLEKNRDGLKFRYDGLGNRLPFIEQVDDEKELSEFVANLDEEEARSFGVSEVWAEYQAAKADQK